MCDIIFVLREIAPHVQIAPAIQQTMQIIKQRNTMAKKASKKAAKKTGKKLPVDGNDPNALGLEGPGAEVPRIAEITRAINEYKEIKDARVALTPKEVQGKQKVIQLMEKHADKLRNPQTGNLTYPLDEKTYVEIEPAKVTIKFHAQKPKKKAKGTKDDQTDLEPEQQEALDQQD